MIGVRTTPTYCWALVSLVPAVCRSDWTASAPHMLYECSKHDAVFLTSTEEGCKDGFKQIETLGCTAPTGSAGTVELTRCHDSEIDAHQDVAGKACPKGWTYDETLGQMYEAKPSDGLPIYKSGAQPHAALHAR